MTLVMLVIILTLFSSLWRVFTGPAVADRLLGVQMMGTTGIAFLLVMAEWQQLPVWRDVALILALLAAVITGAMVQLMRRSRKSVAGDS